MNDWAEINWGNADKAKAVILISAKNSWSVALIDVYLQVIIFEDAIIITYHFY